MNYILSSEALQQLKCKQFVNTGGVSGFKILVCHQYSAFAAKRNGDYDNWHYSQLS